MVNKSPLKLVKKTPEEGTAPGETQKVQPGDFAREFGLGQLQEQIRAAWGEVEFGRPDHDRKAKNARGRFKVIEGGRD